MTSSIFAAYFEKYFKGAIGKITEKWNDRKSEPEFMFEQMLDEEYSADLTWNSTTLNHSIVAADVVSMNSSLPLKRRDSFRTASGDIAKIGIKYKMNEKDISDINVMAAKGVSEASIAAKLLNRVPKAIKGIKTRIEIMFETALSSGYFLFDNSNNDGTGVRANFGYSADNTFHALTAGWEDTANATPVDDIRQLFDGANNNSDSISDVYMSKRYFDLARKTTQMKELVATFLGQVIVNNAYLPMPAAQSTLDALSAEFGATFHSVDNSYKVEMPDGSQINVKPWVQGNVVGVPSAKVGRLVYGTLAEDTNRVAGVSYEKSGNYILVSEYSHNEPSLEEFTAAQALAMPVIDDGSSIYVLHADGTGIISVSPNSLSFAAGANTTGKKVTVHSDKAFTAAVESSATWCTVSTSGNVVTVKVSANTGAARSTTLTVTDTDSNTATVSISQAAGN